MNDLGVNDGLLMFLGHPRVNHTVARVLSFGAIQHRIVDEIPPSGTPRLRSREGFVNDRRVRCVSDKDDGTAVQELVLIECVDV